MEFPDLGKHCSEKTCKQLDFLPLECDACKQDFCKDHFTYAAHKCHFAFKKDVQVPVCPLCNSPVPVKKDEIPDAVVGAHMDGGCKRHPGRKKEALRLGNVKDVKSDMGVPASAVSVLVLKSRVCGLSHVVVSRAHAPGPQLTARVRLPAMRPPPGPASPALPLLLSISEPSGIPCHRTNAIMTNYLEQERVKSVPELLSQTLWLEPPDPFPAPSPPARSCCPRLPRRASEPSGSFDFLAPLLERGLQAEGDAVGGSRRASRRRLRSAQTPSGPRLRPRGPPCRHGRVLGGKGLRCRAVGGFTRGAGRLAGSALQVESKVTT
ncbi:AN1-type zinc finger protein 2A isoform X2 [Balaenoptera ricei]|uniref:AN1-type zinc finger protein 2A isoform X2 n=1 Tax=Balaenoptera ricei TaxID=2746895 RepID=UPI0028BDE1D2|nr:AN1-type zinc finger protein 2A isoform X2 [Balaenoptera ricei]